MTQFPPPLPLDQSVSESRESRRKMLIMATGLGILIRSFLIVLTFLGSYLYNSATLLMDGLFGIVDLISSVLLILGIHYAAKPPDHDHPFGHGRFEPLAGSQIGLLMFIVGFGSFFWQLHDFFQEHPKNEIAGFLWVIPTLSVAAFFWMGRYLLSVAKKKQSVALKAEATHFKWDALTSMIAITALLLAAFFPDIAEKLDAFGAVLIAFCMIFVGLKILKENLNPLLDKVPDQEYFVRVEGAAKRVDGILETEKIRIQQYGPDAHVDIDIEVDPLLSVEEAHTLSQRVRREIQREWPDVREVTVHIEPYYPGDH